MIQKMSRIQMIMISWFPFSVFCIVVESSELFKTSGIKKRCFANVIRLIKKESIMVTYLVCHILGMTTSCTNPLVYGFLNDFFFKEFQSLCPCYWKTCRKSINQPIYDCVIFRFSLEEDILQNGLQLEAF